METDTLVTTMLSRGSQILVVTLRDVDAKSPANTPAERLAELKSETLGDTLADVTAEALLFLSVTQ